MIEREVKEFLHPIGSIWRYKADKIYDWLLYDRFENENKKIEIWVAISEIQEDRYVDRKSKEIS